MAELDSSITNAENKINDPKVMKAWTFYDWANSVYSLVIATAIFPIFFEATTKTPVKLADGTIGETDRLDFFGISMVNTELYSYVIAASLAAVIIVLPIVSGIADYSGKKKFFLKVFCYIGALATASLMFFSKEYIELSMLSVFFASFGFWGSVAIYNSYLPNIATPDKHDFLSAKGFSRGYVGSIILLVICILITKISSLDGTVKMGICFAAVALWWAGFAQYTFKYLPHIPGTKEKGQKRSESMILGGFKEILSVKNSVFKTIRLKRYLIAFFVFSMAVQTIMLMAQFFGMKEIVRIDEFGNEVIGLETNQLIIAILAVQVIAIPGAYFCSWVSSKIGNKKTIIAILAVWILICWGAYAIINTPNEFYFIAGCIGFVMGGTQSIARSTYSKYLPEVKDTTSYFSLYDVAEKIGIVIGLFTFGYIEGITGSMRNSVLALIVFFALGMLVTFMVPNRETIRE